MSTPYTRAVVVMPHLWDVLCESPARVPCARLMRGLPCASVVRACLCMWPCVRTGCAHHADAPAMLMHTPVCALHCVSPSIALTLCLCDSLQTSNTLPFSGAQGALISARFQPMRPFCQSVKSQRANNHHQHWFYLIFSSSILEKFIHYIKHFFSCYFNK